MAVGMAATKTLAKLANVSRNENCGKQRVLKEFANILAWRWKKPLLS